MKKPRYGLAEGKKDLVIRLPIPVWKELKDLQDTGVHDSVSAAIREAIRRYLASRQA